MVSSKFEFSFKEIASEYIAYGLAESSGAMNLFLKTLLYQYPWLLSIGYFCIFMFEISSLTPVLFNRFFVFYGISALLFHLSTGISLNIYYLPTVLAVIFFLIISEFIMEKERNLSIDSVE